MTKFGEQFSLISTSLWAHASKHLDVWSSDDWGFNIKSSSTWGFGEQSRKRSIILNLSPVLHKVDHPDLFRVKFFIQICHKIFKITGSKNQSAKIQDRSLPVCAFLWSAEPGNENNCGKSLVSLKNRINMHKQAANSMNGHSNCSEDSKAKIFCVQYNYHAVFSSVVHKWTTVEEKPQEPYQQSKRAMKPTG